MNGSLIATLRHRLVLVGMVLTALNIAVISFWYVDWNSLRREKVEEQIAAIVGTLVRSVDGQVKLDLPPRLERLFIDYPRAYALRVVAPDSSILFERNGDLIPPTPVAPEALTHLDGMTSSAMSARGRTMAATRKVVLGNQPFLVVFAAAADPARLTFGVYLDELVGHVLLPLVPFAVLLTIINVWTVRRSLTPLVGAAAAARRMERTRSVERMQVEGLPDEVRTLVEAVNDALSRLQQALEHERAFNAEAAHALRTPLAILSARLDAMPGDTVADLRADVSAMTRLVNQMLASAQADALHIRSGQVCDLAATGRAVVAQMAGLAIRQQRQLAFEGEASVLVHGDADALAHAARNLLENAIRYAPSGSEITMEVNQDGALAVSDRGPGMPDAHKALAPARFWRANPGDGLGSGLGLSIVQRIAKAHGGTLHIEDRPGGGARVVLATQVLEGGIVPGESRQPAAQQ
jgi:two-component system, OmpR family, sensor kinase